MMAVMSTTQTIDEPFANEFVAAVRARSVTATAA